MQKDKRCVCVSKKATHVHLLAKKYILKELCRFRAT